MRILTAAFLFLAPLAAQTPAQPGAASTAPAKSPHILASQAMFNGAKNNILRSVDKVPEELWSFQPTPEVRTFAQLFAHVADGQYEFCGMASEGKIVNKDIEKTATTKAAILEALKAAFAYCDAAYAGMTDASSVEMVDFFGRKMPRLGAMNYNVSHTMEHYGNLVTYMRLKKIVPPTSRQ